MNTHKDVNTKVSVGMISFGVIYMRGEREKGVREGGKKSLKSKIRSPCGTCRMSSLYIA